MSIKKDAEKNWLIIVNPNAGRRKGLTDWVRISGILDQYNLNFKAVFTERPGHAAELTSHCIEKEGFKRIVVVGGDGTMNEVVNGIFGQNRFETADITLGMITVGTGNDWGRMFGIPSDYEKAIQVLTMDQTFIQDAGIVKFCNDNEPGERYFVNIAGMGFDAEVALKVNRLKKKGRSGVLFYFMNMLTSLINYKHVQAFINVDGLDMVNQVFSMNVGICKYNGGGMVQSPNAIPDDGLFDLTVINKLSIPRILLSMRRLYDGTIDKHPKVESFTGKSIKVKSRDTIHLETDGESIGHSPLEFIIIPKSIKILTGYFNN